jgi:hypothetical protein
MRTDADVRNASAQRMMDIQLDHQEDLMERMRQESQFAQHQQTMTAAHQAELMNEAAANRANVATDTAAHRSNLMSESQYIGTHQINVQADVMKTGLSNLGQMGTMNLGGGDGQMNPAGMMTGMIMGTAVLLLIVGAFFDEYYKLFDNEIFTVIAKYINAFGTTRHFFFMGLPLTIIGRIIFRNDKIFFC